MKINEIIDPKGYSVSFEVFPPKTMDAMETVTAAAEQIADLAPVFMSVTYGAGGGTSDYTAAVAKDLQDRKHVPVMAHLTCITSDRARIRQQLGQLREQGIENILALRGDIPDGFQHGAGPAVAHAVMKDPPLPHGPVDPPAEALGGF